MNGRRLTSRARSLRIHALRALDTQGLRRLLGPPPARARGRVRRLVNLGRSRPARGYPTQDTSALRGVPGGRIKLTITVGSANSSPSSSMTWKTALIPSRTFTKICCRYASSSDGVKPDKWMTCEGGIVRLGAHSRRGSRCRRAFICFCERGGRVQRRHAGRQDVA